MAAKPDLKKVSISHRERKELEIPDQKCFNHYTLYIGCNVTDVFYSVIKGTDTTSLPRGGPWATNSISEFGQRGSGPAMACTGTNHGLENLMKN